MDDNTRSVLVLAITSGTTIAVAFVRMHSYRQFTAQQLQQQQQGTPAPVLPPPPDDIEG
ncbi:MAG TPA: hypothetical protein VMT27_05400 [Actinomycetes bacterium]|nr:hypothetical protein [Actinomycetes bacterium]